MGNETQYEIQSELKQVHDDNGLYVEETKIGNLNIPQRSYLYSQEPIGVGTPQVECLTSYISRLALNHNILMSRLLGIFSKHANKRDISLSSYTSKLSKCCGNINGTSYRTEDLINGFNILTGRNDLIQLTLLPLKNVLAQFNLFKKTKAFCPFCYEDQKNNGSEPYDLLLWQINVVDVCPIHKINLRSACGYEDCQKVQSYLVNYAIPGYCSKCFRWLGKSTTELKIDETAKDISFQLELVDEIQKLLIETYNANSIPKRENMVYAMNLIKQEYFRNINEFAKFCNVSFVALNDWLKGTYLPNIEVLLFICLKLNISFKEMLINGKILENVRGNLFANEYEMKFRTQIVKKKHLNTDELRNKLDQIIQGCEVPPTVPKIAEMLGISTTSLKRKFPTLSHKISFENQQYRRNLYVNKANNLCRDIETTVRAIYERGEYPSVYKVEAYLNVKSLFFNSIAYEAWKRSLAELTNRNVPTN